MDNIFIFKEAEEEVAKIGDFGYSREKIKKGLVNTLVGSPCTLAPEVIISDSLGYDERADIYSLGIMFYKMLFGEYPYKIKVNLSENYDEFFK